MLPSADAATVRQLRMPARAAKRAPPSVLRKMYPPFTTPTITEPDADIETVPLADAHALAVPGTHGPSAKAGAPYLLSQ